MLKKLFGIGKKDPIQIRLGELQTELSNKNFEKVIAEGQILADQVSEKDKPVLLGILAMANFHNKDYGNANPYFEELSLLSNNPADWFNLCISQILGKEPQKGVDTLENAISSYQERGKRENLSIPYMIFYALSSLCDTEEYNLAFNQLDRMAGVYKEISITDNQFLHSRGYVPFSAILEKAKIILENQTEVNETEWLEDFASALDEDGQIQIAEMIEDINNEKQA